MEGKRGKQGKPFGLPSVVVAGGGFKVGWNALEGGKEGGGRGGEGYDGEDNGFSGEDAY